MKDFAAFQASGRDIADAATLEHLDSQGFSGPGRAYDDVMFITKSPLGYELTIANCRYMAPLEKLERILYDWAVAEGYYS